MIDRRDQRIAKLEAVIAQQQAVIAQQQAVIAQQQAVIAQQQATIAGLEARVADLEARLGQNSSNSGKPPSSDDPAARAGRNKMGRSGRKPGGQPGHDGHQRALVPPEKVTRSRDRFPTRCACCQHGLPQVSHGDPIRHQTVEIPKIEPDVTEHRLHAVACPQCGTVTRAKLPRSVPRGMCGPNLMAFITLLVGVYHMSRRDAVSCVGDVLGIPISLGALSKVEGRVAVMLAPAHKEAAVLVKRARAKYADATGWFRKATGRTLWVIASKLATVFHIVNDGTRDEFQKLVGTLGVLVTDRGSQFGFWAMTQRQICWAHLIRKYVAFSERTDPGAAQLGETLVMLAHVLLSQWHNVRDGTMSREQFQEFVARFRPIFEGHLARGVDLRLDGVSGSCAHMLKHADALWTFAHAPGVQPTNNHAERELRRFVMWRKKSFGSQSERGDHFAERIMSVVHTLRKQDRHVLSFLRDTIAASLRGRAIPSLMPGTP